MRRFGTWLADQRTYLAETYDDDPEKSERREQLGYVRTMVLAAHTELSEALQCLDWKTWRSRKHRPEDAKEELVDSLFFIANILVTLGTTDLELEELYERKSQVNRRRQQRNLDPPCSGPGYAHKAHGHCQGYIYDRT